MFNQEILLNELKPEVIEQFYKKTVLAISIISITCGIGIILFVSLLLVKSYYCFFAIIPPLLGYMWLITLGAKYVNNHYGLKKTSNGTMVFIRRRQNYTAFPIVHVIIFLISAIIRLINEISNLMLIKNLN